MDVTTNITFYDLWLEYKDFEHLKLKAQSYRKILSVFSNHILPYFKNFILVNISHKDYINWQIIIEQKNFKNSYNKFLHSAMVNIFNYAIRFGYIDINIPSKVGGFNRKKYEKKNVNFWTLDEFKKFISVVDNEMYYLLFNTLYFTGLRIGECIALTWEDFNNDYLDINKTISKEKDISNNYIINCPKTLSSIRKIKIDNELVKLFNDLYKKKSKQKCFKKSWFIFGDKKPFTHTTITRIKNNYCEKAGIKKIRLHDFRHSHATLLLSNQVPYTVISQRLGHSDINMTLNTYSHLTLPDIDKAVEFINNIKSTTT